MKAADRKGFGFLTKLSLLGLVGIKKKGLF